MLRADPIMGDGETKQLLDSTKGKTFLALRDEAIIRLYYNTGARLSEIGNLLLTELDMKTESVLLYGKGGKDRRVRFGPKSSRALSRYLRARQKRKGAAEMPQLWLADKGVKSAGPNGIKLMVKRQVTAHDGDMAATAVARAVASVKDGCGVWLDGPAEGLSRPYSGLVRLPARLGPHAARWQLPRDDPLQLSAGSRATRLFPG